MGNMTYEFMAILAPDLSESDRETLLAEIRAEITANGTKITQEDIWGVRTLAYPIRKSETGFYVLFYVETPEGSNFFEVTKALNLKKNLWRFIFTKNDHE